MRGRAAAGRRRDGGAALRCFALTMPGLGPLLAEEVAEDLGARVDEVGNDTRADVCRFTVAGRPAGVLGLRQAEDVFAEIGQARATGDARPAWLAGRLWHAGRAEASFALVAPERRVRPSRVTFRVVVRVRSEVAFRRTDLRRAVTRAVAADRPAWREADPAAVEIWVLEHLPGRYVAGVRLSGVSMRQRGGRAVERRGALRPAVAAAMVRLAGRGRLHDPCCGSGSIAAEARERGFTVTASDLDADAVRAAAANDRDVALLVADAHALPLPDRSLDAVVSNLPFGRQYTTAGPADRWLARTLAEVARVLRPGGRAVLLVPSIPPAAVPPGLRVQRRARIVLLGTRTALWAAERIGDPV